MITSNDIKEVGNMLPKTLSKGERKAIIYFKQCLLDKYSNKIIDLKLFGSKARGDTHGESDIDILILVENREEDLDEFIIDLICETLNQFSVYLETVTYTERDYRHDLDMQYPFLLNVESESISI